MPKRVIVLPNGKSCGLPTYCHSWREVKRIAREHPGARIKGWDHFSEDVGAILRELQYGLHDRINRHIPGYGRGRKWSSDWQRGAIQCAHAVNTPRLVVRWVPQDLRARLQHRITSREEG